jgi:hypothetical protein
MPEWPKGAGCKPVGVAYRGSNPLPPTQAAEMLAIAPASVRKQLEIARRALGGACVDSPDPPSEASSPESPQDRAFDQAISDALIVDEGTPSNGS